MAVVGGGTFAGHSSLGGSSGGGGGGNSAGVGGGGGGGSTLTNGTTSHLEDTFGFAQLDNLQQNQRKLGTLTSRMTTILSNFDRRLARLERDIRPVHEDLHRLGRVSRNIQSVQASLGKTLSTFDVIVDEESTVRAGPNPLDLDPYFQTLTRIADSLAYLRSTGGSASDPTAAAAAAAARRPGQDDDRVTAKMHDLLDLGVRSLIDDVLLPILRNQSHRIDPADYIPLGIPLPTPDHHTAAQCQRLLIFLASLPAHPTSSPNTPPLANAIAQLAEVRAEYLLASTRFLGSSVREFAMERIGSRGAGGGAFGGGGGGAVGMGASVVSGSAMFGGMTNRTEDTSYTRGSAGITEWLGAWLEMAEVEYHFFASLLAPANLQFSSHSQQHQNPARLAELSAAMTPYLRNTFARTVAPSLGFLNSTLAALHSHIRKNLATHMLFLLDLISVISADAAGNVAAGGEGDQMEGLDGMVEGILSGRSASSRRMKSIPARWEYVLSPARLDTEWLLHLAAHHAANNQAAASSKSGQQQQQQQGAGGGGQSKDSQLLADVSADVLVRQANGMKATATAVLTKFIDDIRQMPLGRETDVPSTGINEIAYTGIAYIQNMVEFRDVVTPLLYSLGSGNWLMASSAAPVLTLSGVTGGAAGPGGAGAQYSQYGPGAQSAAQDEADEREKGKRGDAVLRKYIADVAACVCEALAVRSKAIRQNSTASIFLLNNVSFVRNALTDRNPVSTTSPTSPLGTTAAAPPSISSRPATVVEPFLSTAGEDLLSQTLRQANSRYLDAWAPLVSYLMDDAGSSGGGGSGRGGWGGAHVRGGYDAEKIPTKERFAKFYETLEELDRLHRAYPVGREDVALRERLKKEVGRMILPLYGRFVTKHKTSGFSKDPSKHIRMSPQEVEDRINAMFR
ncbi:hypothetical protein V8E36_004875 [Tilletia maclaganii]